MRDAYFDSLSMRAHMVGSVVIAERDASGWGFWLLDKETRDGVWEDDNFSTSLSELENKISKLEEER
jgi:hypothetical protein